MGKNFFSLIYGDKVARAPSTKVIPASEISGLIDAEGVLKKVQEDAERYKREIVSEIENVKAQAAKEGFEAGFKEWVDKIANLEEEIGKVRLDMEKMVIPIALKAAKKIVNKEIEQSEDTIVEIVAGNLKAVSQHKQVTIYVNKKDLEAVEKARSRLKEIFEKLEVLLIREKADVQPGGCVIETESGIINAQLEDRWKILEAAFQNLLKRG